MNRQTTESSTEASPKPSWWTRFITGPRLARLAETFATTRIDLRQVMERERNRDQSWVHDVRALLLDTSSSIQAGEVNRGWRCLMEAERIALAGLDDTELEARAKVTLIEIEKKLKPWRLDAVKAVLEPGAQGPLLPRLQEAIRIRNESFNDRYQRYEMVKRYVSLANLALVVIVAFVLSLSIFSLHTATESSEATDVASDLIIVIATGLLGGVLSVVYSLTRAQDQKIPEHLESAMIISGRPFLGAAAAIAVYLLARTGVLVIKTDSAWDLSTIGLLAGFSERWFLNLMQSMDSQKSVAEKK